MKSIAKNYIGRPRLRLKLTPPGSGRGVKRTQGMVKRAKHTGTGGLL